MKRRLALCAGLVALALASYEGVRHCLFLNYDDNIFITSNPHLAQGLTWEGVRWAFTADLLFDSPNADYWTPLTVLTRLIDVQIFGMSPMGPHLVNLLLHTVSAVLLFLALHSLTAAMWRSAMVAAVFATHPLHVESVAWLTERKDVLSACFWMLSLLAYAAYVRAPSIRGRVAVAAAMACGLMAKPMLITLPFVLLLLDFWPLRRSALGARLVFEKAELFALSLSSVAISIQTTAWMSAGTSTLSLAARGANAVHSYFSYLRDAFYPNALAVGYPHASDGTSPSTIAWEFGALLAVLAAAAAARRSRPYLLTGAFWFAGVLFPVVGLVQVGIHGRADRYTYLPLVGITIAVVWLIGDLVGENPRRRAAAGIAAALILTTFVGLTRRQVLYWVDDLSLFSHAVKTLPDSAIAHAGLAAAWMSAGRPDLHEAELREALRLRPDLVVAIRSLSFALAGRGRLDEAATLVEEALRAIPFSPLATAELRVNLGLIRARQGRGAEAHEEYAAALRVDPSAWTALYNSGNLLIGEGRWADAEVKYRAARELNPDDGSIANNLGLVLLLQGRAPEAAEILSVASQSFPADPMLATSYGRALYALRRFPEAERVLLRALKTAPLSTEAHLRLAQVIEKLGRDEEAKGHYREALRLEPNNAEAAAALARAAPAETNFPRP